MDNKKCQEWWEDQVGGGYFKKYAFYFSAPDSIRRVSLGPDSKVLELGSGYGRETVKFSEITENVYIVDVSASALKLVQENLDKETQGNVQATAKVYDGCHIPFEDDTFDLVTSVFVIQHMSRETAKVAMAESIRVAKPGGIVLHEFFENASYYRGKDGDFLNGMYNNSWPLEDIREMVSACGAGIEWIETKNHGILTGPFTAETEDTFNHFVAIRKERS